MHYIIYKTVNNINNKFYVGKHQTKNLNDGYLGSGKLISAAIKKYGRENFTKVILFIFDNERDMNMKEREIITEEFVLLEETYNLGVGGEGGPHFKGLQHSKETKEKLKLARIGKIATIETRKKISENNFSKREPNKQREHAKNATKLATRNREQISNSLKAFYSTHQSANLGRKHKQLECPHCHKMASKNTAVRWHFDNCKEKPIAGPVRFRDFATNNVSSMGES